MLSGPFEKTDFECLRLGICFRSGRIAYYFLLLCTWPLTLLSYLQSPLGFVTPGQPVTRGGFWERNETWSDLVC